MWIRLTGLAALAVGASLAISNSVGATTGAPAVAHTVNGGCSTYLAPGTVSGMAATPDGGGYWITNNAGQVSTCGSAPNFGSLTFAPARPIAGMVSTPDGHGFWLVGSDGGVFAFGDAGFFGSMGGHPLNRPVVGIATTADGRGYWLVSGGWRNLCLR